MDTVLDSIDGTKLMKLSPRDVGPRHVSDFWMLFSSFSFWISLSTEQVCPRERTRVLRLIGGTVFRTFVKAVTVGGVEKGRKGGSGGNIFSVRTKTGWPYWDPAPSVG